jgi:phosphatidylglycerol:prolipoprotein diacylglycerol transferase
MHPVLVELGPISIRFYGLMYVIGIVLAMLMLPRETRRKGLPLTDDDVANFVLLLVFGGIVGARLYYVAFNGTTMARIQRKSRRSGAAAWPSTAA